MTERRERRQQDAADARLVFGLLAGGVAPAVLERVRAEAVDAHRRAEFCVPTPDGPRRTRRMVDAALVAAGSATRSTAVSEGRLTPGLQNALLTLQAEVARDDSTSQSIASVALDVVDAFEKAGG